ncbi:adenylosuccinate synthetase [Xanthomonas dyei]|uniref:Adenylosuccinate synthetase n=3 Tax=Xanthomonas TaxID=338 RepID=A0A1A9M9B1_9XANT|nr:adenylosuccinate synthetase [Xanthomonas floridensis]MEA5126210.1 adenylosuccinate synthetase [Xanthomonas floridensis]MEA5134124.1 adenylosuccinate synthetase [Xanthomonas floridensis]OAG66641.1 adenylosuccinate synthetase [Xanthomonas floridensis]PPU58975.1 adenylosuccinate synthetase [Xanthomonas dyei]
MPSHRVVIISGKRCSGKSGLAKALAERYGFRLISTDDILSGQLELSSGHVAPPRIAPRTPMPDRDRYGEWVNESVQKIYDSLKEDEPGIVVDAVRSVEQVNQLRQRFHTRLTHVHLYASKEVLLQRYIASTTDNPGGLVYDQLDDLDDGEIKILKEDADVRIYTVRADHEDTLVRVAAHLHLLTPPDVRCVDVLVGGQYGSEGKGNIVAYLANEYDVLVRVGGPNAGHTVANAVGKAIHHQLPSGASFSNAKLLLGAGFTINVKGLLEEIAKFKIGPDRLFIDPQATIIEEEDITLEKGGVVGAIASTGSGSGAAKARRILNRGNASKLVKLARDIPELKPYIGSTEEHLEHAYRKGHSVLLEGTQGSALSLYHGAYPHVTSRDTNVAGCLAEAGISPSRVRKILMVVRTTPIRVADPDGEAGNTSGKLKNETTFAIIAGAAGLDAAEVQGAEITSTTKRNRRVGWFEWSEFRRACNLNAPTDIVLTFVDYLDEANQKARRFDQLAVDTIKFIEELERVAQAPVSLINTRFPKKDSDFKDLRSIIDRRNWTARSRLE